MFTKTLQGLENSLIAQDLLVGVVKELYKLDKKLVSYFKPILLLPEKCTFMMNKVELLGWVNCKFVNQMKISVTSFSFTFKVLLQKSYFVFYIKFKVKLISFIWCLFRKNAKSKFLVFVIVYTLNEVSILI